MQAHSITRAEQAAVLFILMDAHGEPLTPLQIACRVNARFSPHVPASRVGVECALACIALRPSLKRRLRLHTRPTTRVERQSRARLGIPMLLTATIVAACSVQPLGQKRYAHGYFGSPQPVARSAPHRAPPVLQSEGSPSALAWALPSNAPAEANYAALGSTPNKVVGGAAGAPTLSYFDEAPLSAVRWAQPRQEAALVTDVASAAISAPTAPPMLTLPAAPVLSTQRIPVGLRDEIASYSTDADSLAELLASQGQSLRDAAVAIERALSADLAPAASASAAMPSPSDRMAWTNAAALPPVDHDGQYWIGFRNGSQRVLPEGAVALKTLAEYLPEQAEIRLRGRVGFRSPTGRQVELAVGRALAVKAQLVAAGVPADAIRIQFPQANDWLDGSRADAPANMSVSVYLDDASKRQIAARLQPAFVAAVTSR